MTKRIIQTTEGIASRERWDYWKATALAAVDAEASVDPAKFMASRTFSQIARATLIETTSQPVSMHRNRNKIAGDGVDHACLVVGLAGGGVLSQGNRPEEILRPGNMLLYDLGRPYSAASTEAYHELRLYVPRDVFAMRVGSLESLSGLKFDGGIGLANLFTTYIKNYAALLPSLSAQQAEIGMDGVIHLLSGLVSEAIGNTSGDGASPSRETLRALSLRQIEALLSDPRLDVAMLARAVGVSRSRLYEAFVGSEGVAAAIRDTRLDRARLRLSAPEQRHRTLEEIARLCGFIEYATFTRAFRRRFGISPSDARADAFRSGAARGGWNN